MNPLNPCQQSHCHIKAKIATHLQYLIISRRARVLHEVKDSKIDPFNSCSFAKFWLPEVFIIVLLLKSNSITWNLKNQNLNRYKTALNTSAILNPVLSACVNSPSNLWNESLKKIRKAQKRTTLRTGIIVPRTFINFCTSPNRRLLIQVQTIIRFGHRSSTLLF